MKEKFLVLVKEIKNTGIVEALYKTSNAEELKATLQEFCTENQKLIKNIKDWASDFKASGTGAIFEKNEAIDNPMEIAVCIKIINDIDVTECEIFGTWVDLMHEIESIGNDFAAAVAYLIDSMLIYEITAEDIFNIDCDEEEYDDSDTEKDMEEDSES